VIQAVRHPKGPHMAKSSGRGGNRRSGTCPETALAQCIARTRRLSPHGGLSGGHSEIQRPFISCSLARYRLSARLVFGYCHRGSGRVYTSDILPIPRKDLKSNINKLNTH
jgi:hypothetical protein